MYPNHDFSVDTSIQLKDAGLVASTAVATVGGSAAVWDLGAAVFTKGRIIIDTTAVEVATGDEYYAVELQGSDTSGFSTAYHLAEYKLGDSTTTLNGVDSPAIGRHVLYFDNIAHKNATLDAPAPCRYMRLRTVVAGTVATGVNYVAYGTTDPT